MRWRSGPPLPVRFRVERLGLHHKAIPLSRKGGPYGSTLRRDRSASSRSVIYAMDAECERLFSDRTDNDSLRLLEVVSAAGERAEVVIAATYGWYWAVDLLR